MWDGERREMKRRSERVKEGVRKDEKERKEEGGGKIRGRHYYTEAR